MEEKKNNLGSWASLIIVFVIALALGNVFTMVGWSMMGNLFGQPTMMHDTDHYQYHQIMSMDENRLAYLEHRDGIMDDMRADGDYACCLETPCTYCIEKTPGHGAGASCHCLSDIMNGEHPCGECIGEILEGHGNKYLSQYFASAIAEEVGEDHLEAIQQIISEKYGISIDEQL